MSLLTEFPSGYRRPEPLNKSFDMTVRDWSRQQFGGDDIVDEIRKALNTGIVTSTGVNQYGPVYPNSGGQGAGQGSALRLENLDNTMTSVLATAEHLKIFRFLHKEPSKQPFYQWNRRDSYGSTRGHFGFAEGGAPTGGAGQWSRNGAYVKFLGTRGGVTHPAVLTNILGGMSVDPVAEDQLGRTMDFMQRIERAVMYGDEAILDASGSDSNYDGLLKQLTTKRKKNIIDMKGKPLTMDVLANTASRLVTEGKLLSFQDVTLFMSPQNIEDFGKLRYSTQLGTVNGTANVPFGPGTSVDRSDITSSARNNLLAGLSIVGQSTSFGVIPFEWSIFTEPVEGGAPLATGDSGTGVPANGPACGQLVITAEDTVLYPSNMEAGVYAYGVSSVSDAGESAPAAVALAVGVTTTNTASGPTLANLALNSVANVKGDNARANVTVAAGDSVIITIASVASAKSYRVYRCKLTGSSEATPAFDATGSTGANRWQYVGHLPGTAGTFTDRNGTPELYNNFRAGTNIAPLICRNSADLCIAQMSPLLKMPLAPTNTTFEYLLLLYHTLVLKSPERQFIFKNVGALN
jgi:hypothetical protein